MTQTQKNEANALRREINNLIVNEDYSEMKAVQKVLSDHYNKTKKLGV